MFSTITTAPSTIMPMPIGETAERHQVRAQSVPFHHDEGEERGQRQDERDDDRAAHVGEQHNENDEHENRAFLQAPWSRCGSPFHEIACGRKTAPARRLSAAPSGSRAASL